MCIFVCLNVEPGSESKDCFWSRIKMGLVLCLYTPVSPNVPEREGINLPQHGILS